MRVPVACEEGQAVTIEPCSGGHPEWHLQECVKEVLKQSWDMIIAHAIATQWEG